MTAAIVQLTLMALAATVVLWLVERGDRAKREERAARRARYHHGHPDCP